MSIYNYTKQIGMFWGENRGCKKSWQLPGMIEVRAVPLNYPNCQFFIMSMIDWMSRWWTPPSQSTNQMAEFSMYTDGKQIPQNCSLKSQMVHYHIWSDVYWYIVMWCHHLRSTGVITVILRLQSPSPRTFIPATRTLYAVPLSNIVKLKLLAAGSFTVSLILLCVLPCISYSITQELILAVVSLSTTGG